MSDEHIKPYAKAAGGWDSLKRSWQALRDEGIVTRGAKALLRTNQAEGFDCPGCAWPDRNPNSTFEFCENGVKAVAAEATSKRQADDDADDADDGVSGIPDGDASADAQQ